MIAEAQPRQVYHGDDDRDEDLGVSLPLRRGLVRNQSADVSSRDLLATWTLETALM